jgi:formate/nitrite transporter
MIAVVLTFAFTVDPNEVGEKLGSIGAARTVGYAAHGAAGMLTLFIRGVLCNWMVSTGVVAAMISTSVSGKVIAMWMPILVFFHMGFEHSVVNMFLFPSGLMMGGDFSIGDYFIWNEIPTVVGNLVGGITFVGLTLYATHARTAASRDRELTRTSISRPTRTRDHRDHHPSQTLRSPDDRSASVRVARRSGHDPPSWPVAPGTHRPRTAGYRAVHQQPVLHDVRDAARTRAGGRHGGEGHATRLSTAGVRRQALPVAGRQGGRSPGDLTNLSESRTGHPPSVSRSQATEKWR